MELLAAITLPIFAFLGILATGSVYRNGKLPKPHNLQPTTKGLVTILLGAAGAGLIGWAIVLIYGIIKFFS